MIKRIIIYFLLSTLSLPLLTGCAHNPDTVVIGGKKFSEQSILGEMYAALIEKHTDLKVDRRFFLGGTQVVHEALLRGDIDMYPEYTGTAYQVILKKTGTTNPDKVYQEVKTAYQNQFDATWLDPLGFNNTYALTMHRDHAQRLKIRTISDLTKHDQSLTAGFDPEFLERPDGWPGLQQTYGLRFSTKPRQLDPGLVYRAVANNKMDVVDTYSTDGRIPAFHLIILQDDKNFFPPYYAAPIVRNDLLTQHPNLRKVLNLLAGKLDEPTMQRLNYEVDEKQRRPEEVAREWLRENGFL